MTTTVSKRPFRLYDSKTKKFLRGRCYKHFHNCHIGALIAARWSDVGTTVEVIDKDHGDSLRAQYTRTPTTVKFTEVAK